jgi:hypothetical protein
MPQGPAKNTGCARSTGNPGVHACNSLRQQINIHHQLQNGPQSTFVKDTRPVVTRRMTGIL